MHKGKIILITGGSSGIGMSVALLFAKNGADVVITYKSNKKGAMHVVTQVEQLGRMAVAIKANLSKERQAERVVSATIKKFGKIDILINNAGRYIDGDEWDGSSTLWLESIEQNLVSIMNVSKYVLKEFVKQRNGVMINIASAHGMHGQPEALSYAASKAGVINITQAYAELLLGFGRANSVSPSATNVGYWLTAPKDEIEQTLANRPNHKFVDVETVAQKILFLASDDAKNITGHNFPVSE